MTPGARVAAAIEILDTYLAGTPAEQALTSWGRNHRFAGSKDRAAIRDHVYDALRRLRSSEALGGASTGRAIMIGCLRSLEIDPQTLFTAEGYAPEFLTDDEINCAADMSRSERFDCPEWLLPHVDESLGGDADQVLEALRHRAPVFLRANLARTSVEDAQAVLMQDVISTQPHPLAKSALGVTENPRKINGSTAFRDGLVELQDAASQAVIETLQITPGMRVLDYCAGGGGKSLAMAALGAEVVAHDIAPDRMKDIAARAERAGCRIQTATTEELSSLAPFDLVLADAPCSGSGSWRRAPHGKWLMSPERLDEVLAAQRQVLSQIGRFVTSDGMLAYATCSFLKVENRDQVDDFTAKYPQYKCVFDQSYSPTEGGDGFYIAHLKEK